MQRPVALCAREDEAASDADMALAAMAFEAVASHQTWQSKDPRRRGFCLLSPSVPRPYHQARLVIHASELSMWVSSSIRNHCPGLIRRRRPKVSILRHVKLGEEITYEEVYPFEYRSGHNDCLP